MLPLLSDPNIKMGKLDNGLTYYIRSNHKPENRVFMYLVIKAGSINEDNDQQGLAHFVEHMAFNGTLHFKKNQLVDALEKMGVKYGAELNAQTSYNETVYNLEIPSDNSNLIDKGFLILENWAHNISFDDKEIEREKSVIKEEYRLRGGTDLPVLLKDSRYAERTPIGKMNIINNCNHDALRQFYYDWYRPDLMAIIIVGDIDINSAERKIKEHFTQLKNPDKERKVKEYEIPDNKEPNISLRVSREETKYSLQIYYKHNKENQTTVGDYKTFILQNLYIRMLNRRLLEISQKSDAPYIYACASYRNFFSNNKEAFELIADAKENKMKQCIETILLEIERVKTLWFYSN